MIAVSFALPEESKEFIGLLHHQSQLFAGNLPIVLGNIDGTELVVCHTGVGPASAEKMIGTLFSLQRPQCLISAGFAGALDPNLECGDLVVGENFSDAVLVEANRSLGVGRCAYGKLTTQSTVIETAAAKSALARETCALAVDMETQAIRERCAQAGVPMLSLRAISDTARESLPVPFEVWFDPAQQKPHTARLVRFLLRHPGRLGPFARFVRSVIIARGQLTRHLQRLVVAV
jgi:adenosylhomocysteine nucleosidase